ncbi:MAG TPA: FAD-dependent oxidoreductase, partial [Polyangiaceae bacterium]|nr:FAD-dependent oxidoreductase [Polyangiaceae bacterium]
MKGRKPKKHLSPKARMNANKSLDVIVVGAGVGGLSAAISLGSAQLRVLVLESAKQIGGKAGTASFDGVEFDTGPSVLTMPETFDAVFAQAGLEFRSLVRLRRPEPAFRYHFPSGASLDVFHEPERTYESIASVFGIKARDEFRRYLDGAKALWSLAAPHFVLSEAPDIGALLFSSIRQLRTLSTIDPLRTLQTAIERTVQTPELRMLLERYATYNGSDVRRAPAALGCIAHIELGMGGYGVEGGMVQLVHALGQAATRVGVEIRTQQTVAGLIVRSGRIAGIRTDSGQEILAERVVVNADLGHLAETLLPPSLGKPLLPEGELSMSAYSAVYMAKKR